MSIWYSVIEHDPNGESRYKLPTTANPDRWGAQWCAEDYHDSHDGWQATWPLTFVIYETEDGPETGRFEIKREAVPTFYARKVA